MKSLSLKFIFHAPIIKRIGSKSYTASHKQNSFRNWETIWPKLNRPEKKKKSKPIRKSKESKRNLSSKNNKEATDFKSSNPTSTKSKRTENKF
jgi:hypothetical protein